MENIFREYMERAFAERGPIDVAGPRPVVTISREFGCPSRLIAQHLTNLLNRRHGHDKPARWRFINKEIVEAAAQRLEMNTGDVHFNMNAGGQGLIQDVLASFSPVYVSNLRMKNTITSVVRSIAEQGFVIIVGRGGAGILQDLPNAVHVRLMAPKEWRIGQICLARDMGPAEAAKLVDETDMKRAAFIGLMMGGKFNPYLFDLALNCSKLSDDEICRTIIGLMETKHMTE